MGACFSKRTRLSTSHTRDIVQELCAQIYIKTTSGKVIAIDFKKADTLIQNVKEKIQEIEGVSPTRQVLQYGGKELIDSKTLEDYNIDRECVLELREWVIEIVNTSDANRMIRLEVDPNIMTIEDIKAKIEKKEGIRSNYQVLFIRIFIEACPYLDKTLKKQVMPRYHSNNVDLDNHKSIHSLRSDFSELQPGCLIFLKLPLRNIHVKIHDGESILWWQYRCLEVNASATISDIKMKIQDEEDNIPIDEQLLYHEGSDTLLKDDQTFDEYQIQKTIRLILHLRTYIRIIFRNTISEEGTRTWEQTEYFVSPAFTVRKVIEKTLQNLQISHIPVEQRLLLYDGKELEYSKTLSDYKIKNKYELYLVPANYQKMPIIVKSSQMNVMLEVEPSDTIEDVIKNLEKKFPNNFPLKGRFKSLHNDVKLFLTNRYKKKEISESECTTDRYEVYYGLCKLMHLKTVGDHNIQKWAILSLHSKCLYNISVGGVLDRLWFGGIATSGIGTTISGKHVHEKEFQAFVKTPTGKTVTIEVDSEDTIEDVKKKIQEKTKIPPNEQRLFFGGQDLDSEKLVIQYNIGTDSLLHLMRTSESDIMQIFIERPCGHSFEVYANSSDMISTIKAKIERDEKDQKDEHNIMIVYNGSIVEDDKKLSDYNIKSCSLLHLLETQCSMTIKIKTNDGETASVPVNPNNTVLSLKVRIWVEIEGVSAPCRQKLIYNNEHLHDSQTLSYYLIHHGCTIQVNSPTELSIKHIAGKTLLLYMHLDETVATLKSKLKRESEIEPSRQQLYCSGKILEDRDILKSYSLDFRSLVILCKAEFLSELAEEVGSEGRQITWSEEGLKVNVPAGVVPDGQEITMVIRKYDATHASFIFPAHTKPVSPVYEMYWSHDVNQGMFQVSITHTSLITHQGCFVQASRSPSKLKASDNTPEFHFTQLPGGDFDAQTLCGKIGLQQLSLYLATASYTPPSTGLMGWFWSLFSNKESNSRTAISLGEYSTPTSIQGNSRKREQTEGHDGEDLPTVQAKRVRQDSITEETEPQEERDTQPLLEQISPSTSQSYTAPAHQAPNAPELKDLVIVLKAVEWHSLGIQLGIEKHVLDRIDDQYPQKLINRKRSEMLGYWFDNEPNPTWGKIVTALERLGGYSAVVRTIQSKTATY